MKVFLAAILTLVTFSQAFALEFWSNGLYYETQSSTSVCVQNPMDVTAYSGSITIPPYVEHEGVIYKVTGIGKHAFTFSINLASVSLPETLETIEDDAFGTAEGMESIFIPKNVRYISNFAFSTALSLETFRVDPENQFYTSVDGVLYTKDMRTLVRLPANRSLSYYKIPESVLNIEAGAFCGTQLQNIDFPQYIESIGVSAFSFARNLKHIVFPEGIKDCKIDFTGCESLETVKLPSTTTSVNGFLGVAPKLQQFIFPAGTDRAWAESLYQWPDYITIVIGDKPLPYNTNQPTDFANYIMSLNEEVSQDAMHKNYEEELDRLLEAFQGNSNGTTYYSMADDLENNNRLNNYPYISQNPNNCNTEARVGTVSERLNQNPIIGNTRQDVQPAQKLKRIALVMGNANYNRLYQCLLNPTNDASDLADKLESLGFTVLRSIDATHQQMETDISKFGELARDYQVALFYYAGHGISSSGYNYLVPIDTNLPEESHVKYNCTNANLVLDVLDRSGCDMKIMILDACRNNPFARAWHRGLENEGLTTMSAPRGTFIAFSTAPCDVAMDGGKDERNCPYTSALLETLDVPNLSITDFFQEVLEKVAVRTNERQSPWSSNSFRGKFYFNKE